MPKRTTDYRSALLEDLRDPLEAAHYLNAALEDSAEMLLAALRDVAEARQMAKVAEEAGVSRESLYRMLTSSGNPTYRNFLNILQAAGLELAGVRPAGTGGEQLSSSSPGAAKKAHTSMRSRGTRNLHRKSNLSHAEPVHAGFPHRVFQGGQDALVGRVLGTNSITSPTRESLGNEQIAGIATPYGLWATARDTHPQSVSLGSLR